MSGHRTDPYGGSHRSIRRALLPGAVGSMCTRCGRPILDGQPVDLDHADDRGSYLGWAHSKCNRSSGGRLGNARKRAKRQRRRAMLAELVAEMALGVEISADRAHTALVGAGLLDGDLVYVELVGYVAGTDAVAELGRVHAERKVLVTAIDPRSPAATLIRPARAAGIAVTEPSTSDLVLGHGLFLDALAAGRLRHGGQSELTAAMRYLQQRPMGGSVAPDRRGAQVDVAPGVAAVVAVWALLTAEQPPEPFALFGT